MSALANPALIPVAAWNTLKKCHVIFAPRAKTMNHSVARGCLPTDEIPQDRFREIEFAMESDRSVLSAHYTELAEIIAIELQCREGRRLPHVRRSVDLFDLRVHARSDCRIGYRICSTEHFPEYRAIAP